MFKHFLITITSLGILICSSSFVATAQSNSAKQVRKLTYLLEPVIENEGLRFRVSLTFKGEVSGKTTLVLPDSWGGQEQLYKSIQQLQVISSNAKLSDTDKTNIKIITHSPNQELHLQYELVQDFAGNPTNAVRYRPILRKDYFHWIGHGAWVYPAWEEDKPVSVSLEWKNLPKTWAIANSFAANQQNQRFQTTIEAFTHAIFVGGDFRIRNIAVGGKPVYTAVRGTWQFSDEVFADLVQKVIKVERKFWSDNTTPYYLVTLLSLEAPPNNLSLGGTGLNNSFATFSTPNADLNSIKSLLAHEYFHNWNSRALGILKEPQQQLYWFSEGFTDYYTYLLLLRGELMSIDEYLQKFNELTKEYYFSPVRTENSQRIVKDFWNDSNVQKLPYLRGFLLAANWNALIRASSGGKNSLDDVMLDIFKAARKNRPILTAESVNEYISRYVKQGVSDDIQRYAENGELIMPDKNMFGSHVQMEMIEIPSFELGIDLDSLRNKKVIAGVIADSAAYRAGLRDGQTVVRRLPIYTGDATKPVEITIKEDSGEKTIKYYPTSRTTVSVPQFKMREGLSDKERGEILQLMGVNSLTN